MLTVIVAIAMFGAGAAVGTIFGMSLARSTVTALTAQIRRRDLALKSLTEERDQ